MTIEIDNLRIRFGEREVVKGVSFQVPEGGSFGIVGESGSGKSTVLRAMAGLNTSWMGRIAFNGDPGTTYRVAIFDMNGLLVYTTEGIVFAGVGGTAQQPGPGADYAVSVSWPLVNGVGEPAASGVYLVVVESLVNGQRQLAKDKLIVIR